MSKKEKPVITAGIKTTEFWLALVAIVLGAVLSAQVLEGQWAKIAAVALSVLTALGYGASRAAVKKVIAKGSLVLPLAFMLAACGGWQKPMLKTAHTVTLGINGMHEAAKVACKPAIKLCRDRGCKELSCCVELSSCQDVRRDVLLRLDLALRANLMLILAIDLKDEPTAANAVLSALAAYRAAVDGLINLGIDCKKWRL